MSELVFGPTTVAVPDGWTETKREGTKVAFVTEDQLEFATISHRTFGREPSFGEFEVMCEQRLTAERQALEDGFVESKGASEQAGVCTLIYFGGDKATNRMFSGFLLLAADTLVTIYVEGLGIEPQRHMASFGAFAQGCKVVR
jgi:hypothetical protein